MDIRTYKQGELLEVFAFKIAKINHVIYLMCWFAPNNTSAFYCGPFYYTKIFGYIITILLICIIQTTTWPKWWGPYSSAWKLLSVTMFLFPTLLADPIKNLDRVPALYTKLRNLCPFILNYFNVLSSRRTFFILESWCEATYPYDDVTGYLCLCQSLCTEGYC